MSKVARIAMLKSFVEQEPENPFNYYALALEHLDFDLNSATDYFKKLLEEYPEYLPTYFHAASFFADQGEVTSSKNIYEKGIQLAEFQKDEKAIKELKNSYQNFLFENDLY
ncbi:tetratricopeptide repeat protein [Aquiflexum sp. TKW24L]|uniref:tetratricopeptide repeat protein n=1 Tax=Aquiflexum sp. TKW24L TaxID=2942212 RepID=UPI0020C092D5|nr:tetratricopeptide repeat protein [Aquiflexum sp. TKW24L]MCL6258745.1 tetratricopeptide repeat protein [Aquiflexum sp. TKW24L]